MMQEKLTQLEARVHVGADASMRARVPDTSTVLLKAGLSFWAEVALAEAPATIAAAVARLRRQRDRADARVATIRTHVKLTQQALADLAGII
jgi:prefoldin subunit 5